MSDFSSYGLLGLCVGFLWGIGCSLAILYSIYLGGYRKGVADSLADDKPRRFVEAIKKIQTRREKKSPSAQNSATLR
jgi:hypothetical protein